MNYHVRQSRMRRDLPCRPRALQAIGGLPTTAAPHQREEGTMRSMKRGIWSFVVMLGLAGALAGPAHASFAQYYDYITKVYVAEDGYLMINVKGNFSRNHGCNDHSYVKSLYQVTDARAQAWLQLATASLLSRTKV